jgi:uncharacterized protein DUF4926
MKPFDVVAITTDIPAAGLVRGQVGTIVDIMAPGFFEVEFVDDDGRTYGLLTVPERDLIVLYFEKLVADSPTLPIH